MDKPRRRLTRVVRVGGTGHVEALFLGTGHPVAVQTMWKDPLTPEALDGAAGAALEERLETLRRMGMRLLRFAVPDEDAALALGRLARRVTIPLVADIHFDYRLALRVLDFPVAKIRVNPGNIGSKARVLAVLEKARDKGAPVRIGVNSGSLPADLRRRVAAGELGRSAALAEAAERELAVFDEAGFYDALVSIKASSVSETIEANRLLAARCDAPLHIGVTEAGPLVAGVARSAAALYTLLSEGIGDTLRVSLSDSVENEVAAGREIAGAVYERASHADNETYAGRGARIVSCPRCGRCGFDTHAFTRKWQPYLYALRKDVTVAIMGCAVNGPEEGRQADVGITGAGDKVLLFKRGRVIKTCTKEEADEAFKEALDSL